MFRPLIAGVASVVLLSGVAGAQVNYDVAKQATAQRTDAARAAAAGTADVKVWDGVIADKKAHTVTLLAVATNIKPTDPLEFFVSTVVSGKDYESLFVTFAKPADVQAALQFIGLSPGKAIDPVQNQFWARGPRVVMAFKTPNGQSTRVESIVVDGATGKPILPTAGVYTGSALYADANGRQRHIADDTDSVPIASTYSDPNALLDAPTPRPQGATYGKFKPAAALPAKPGDPVDVILSPATGGEAVSDLSLELSAVPRERALRYTLAPRNEADRPTTTSNEQTFDDLPNLIAAIAAKADGRTNLFTSVRIDPNVSVTDARKLFAVLESVEKDPGLKLDAPADSGLPHAAFFPDPAWKDRTTRLGEPWELYLSRKADRTLVARLERQVDDPDATPRTQVQTTQPADPAAMAAHVSTNATQWSKALFVYPPADLTYGELLAWTGPVRGALPRVFVYPPDDAAASKR